MRRNVSILLAAVMAISLFLAGCSQQVVSSSAPAQPTQTSQPAELASQATEDKDAQDGAGTHIVVDAFGREVEVPDKIERVIPCDAYPVGLSYILAVGEGDKVVCGLPTSFSPERWKYTMVFAPQTEGLPAVMASGGGDPYIEQMIELEPDVVFCSSEEQADNLTDKNFTVVCLRHETYEDSREAIRIMGDVFGKQEEAERYLEYFDETLAQVKERTDTIPEEEKKRVLYFDKSRMVRPNLVCEWWIPAAGGVSVTADQSDVSSVELNMEALLTLDPDIIIEMLHSNVDAIYADSEWAGLTAVQNEQVFSTPVGCHVMGNWTSEQPIMVLWAAQKFYPELFADIDLVQEFKDFYSEFYGVALTTEQVEDIIEGDRE